MFCFGVGVKDSPNSKISFSSWMSGTLDKLKTFMDCGCVIRDSCDSCMKKINTFENLKKDAI